MSKAERMHTLAEAASLYGCARASMQQRVTRGSVAAVRSELKDATGQVRGWQWLIPHSELERLIAARDGAPQEGVTA